MPTVSRQPTSIRVSRIQVAIMLSLGVPGVVFLGSIFTYIIIYACFDDRFWKREILSYLFRTTWNDFFLGTPIIYFHWGYMPIKIRYPLIVPVLFLGSGISISRGSPAELRIHALDLIAATAPPATCRDAGLQEMRPQTCLYLSIIYHYV
jgi:hypothetical protein